MRKGANVSSCKVGATVASLRSLWQSFCSVRPLGRSPSCSVFTTRLALMGRVCILMTGLVPDSQVALLSVSCSFEQIARGDRQRIFFFERSFLCSCTQFTRAAFLPFFALHPCPCLRLRLRLASVFAFAFAFAFEFVFVCFCLCIWHTRFVAKFFLGSFICWFRKKGKTCVFPNLPPRTPKSTQGTRRETKKPRQTCSQQGMPTRLLAVGVNFGYFTPPNIIASSGDLLLRKKDVGRHTTHVFA